MRYVALDLETTGFSPRGDRIVEFCLIELCGELREQRVLVERVNPGRGIPHRVSAIHGITDRAVAACLPFAAFAGTIQTMLDGACLLAHNAKFDLPFLNEELQRAGFAGVASDHPVIDTLVIERRVAEPGTSRRLAAAYERYTGEPLEGAHGALADVRAMVEVLRGQRRVHETKLPAGLQGLRVDALQAHEAPSLVPAVASTSTVI